MTLEEALFGLEIPPEIRRELTLLDLEYWSFDEQRHSGQMVLHHALAGEVAAIFADIAAARFPIARIIPVVHYGWSDDASMADNNTSCFNYRPIVGGGRLSYHSFGRAIDINPVQNPYVKGALVLPPGAVYDPAAPGTILNGGPVVAAFARHGWEWGGRWTHLLDWQHFQKP